ncbi:hypothetical protein KY346_00185 [Candidatus Woesearchaeota archaeon]|nr:hypothetical protein [Candidatus Woesearchaeota archaeon]
MALTRDIRIKVTPLQQEIIKNKAQVAGYKSVSAFIRDTIINEENTTEDLIKEIHEIVVKEKET